MVYKQTTKFTCSVSSLMNLIKLYKKDFPLTRDTELEFWQKAVILPIRRCSIFALAKLAEGNDIPTSIIVEDTSFLFPEYRFKKYRKFEVELAETNEKRHLKNAKGIKVEERDFDIDEMKNLLKKGKKLLVRLNIGVLRNTTANKKSAHYIAVTDFKDNRFTVLDPRVGEKQIKEERMQEAFATVKEKCKRDHRMIILG